MSVWGTGQAVASHQHHAGPVLLTWGEAEGVAEGHHGGDNNPTATAVPISALAPLY